MANFLTGSEGAHRRRTYLEPASSKSCRTRKPGEHHEPAHPTTLDPYGGRARGGRQRGGGMR